MARVFKEAALQKEDASEKLSMFGKTVPDDDDRLKGVIASRVRRSFLPAGEKRRSRSRGRA